MGTCRRVLLVGASMLVVAACVGEAEPPELESLPPATVPSDWISYTDETASFQLAYPGEWTQMEVDRAAVEEILNPLLEGSDVEVGTVAFVFGAGVPSPATGGFDPNVNVQAESLPVEPTAEEYAAASRRGVEDIFTTWETTSQSKVRIGERDAVLAHANYELSELFPAITDGTRVWAVLLNTTDGKTGWTLTCAKGGIEASEVADDLETCEAVVRSFRLLTD